MQAHSIELLQLAIWALTVVFGAFIALLMWLGKGLWDRVTALPDALQGVANSLRGEHEADSRQIWGKLDEHGNRITKLETRCDAFHAVRKQP